MFIRQLTVLLLCCIVAAAQAQRVKKVVFVIADGIPADVLETVPTPHIDSIAASGAYLRAHVGGDKGTYSETPTISAVGYNSLLTGTWVNKHNVWDNDIKAPDYNYPTIFKLLKAASPAKKIAVFSSWQENRTKLVGDGLPQTGNLKVDIAADGYELDTVQFPHDKQRDFMHRIDERVVTEAVNSLRTTAPDLSWVYLEYTDDMGHMYGDAPQFYTAVEMMDKQIGRLWNAIQYRSRHFNEDWLLVVTTDHGRAEANGKGHGGQSPRQRNTWILLNKPDINSYAKLAQPGIVDIFPTIARFMQVPIPQAVLREVDGIPLAGKVSVANMNVNVFQHKLDISWTALDATPGDKLKVWISTTNQVQTGGTDNYTLLGEVPVLQKHATFPLNNDPDPVYKIVLEAPHNTINQWWAPKEGSK
ncbi:alkaline phosphatase family protein [Deminuibacter soli]|uniref:Alkaline phosphatase family protein n=1 Tax=Deminuibacter soli TaxID=2291815 RepID=A0A3E1NI68_9BACT|nr:alkaline phosphatase family protein [Deminuibacter soli]RFM27636.1 alkaline phosphatase family protein [Deminuibacter soli]